MSDRILLEDGGVLLTEDGGEFLTEIQSGGGGGGGESSIMDNCCGCDLPEGDCGGIQVYARRPFTGAGLVRPSAVTTGTLNVTNASDPADLDNYYRTYSEIIAFEPGIDVNTGFALLQRWHDTAPIYSEGIHRVLIVTLSGKIFRSPSEEHPEPALFDFSWTCREEWDLRTGIIISRTVSGDGVADPYSYELDTETGVITESGSPDCLLDNPFPGAPGGPTVNVTAAVAAGGSASGLINGNDGWLEYTVPADYHGFTHDAYTVRLEFEYSGWVEMQDLQQIVETELLEFVQLDDLAHVYSFNIGDADPATDVLEWNWVYRVDWRLDFEHETGWHWPLEPFIWRESSVTYTTLYAARWVHDRLDGEYWGQGERWFEAAACRFQVSGDSRILTTHQYNMMLATNSTFELLNGRPACVQWTQLWEGGAESLPRITDCLPTGLGAGEHILRPGDVIYQYGHMEVWREYNWRPVGEDPDTLAILYGCGVSFHWEDRPDC